MPRVLLLTQVLPYPLDAGPKVRAHHMLNRLAQRHEVFLVSFVRSDDKPEWVDALRPLCAGVETVLMQRSMGQNVRAAVVGLATGRPIFAARDEIAEMSQAIEKVVRQFRPDVVHADQLSMAGYGLAAAAVAERRPATILDEHNAVYLLAQRMASTESSALRRLIAAREGRAFADYEVGMCRAYDHVLTVTSEDKDRLLSLYPDPERAAAGDHITVVPICVDPEKVSIVPRVGAGPPTILHLGTMFWPPNVAGVLWFAREVLPLIWQSEPSARFVVVGKKPPEEVTALSSDPRIEVTGYVADPTPYLAAADAFVVPLLAGGGMRVKILDAWLWGMPIISTPIGAEGIAVQDEENILLSESAEDFAASTVRALQDPELNARLRREGRAWAETHYAWQTVYQRVDTVYDELLRSRP